MAEMVRLRLRTVTRHPADRYAARSPLVAVVALGQVAPLGRPLSHLASIERPFEDSKGRTYKRPSDDAGSLCSEVRRAGRRAERQARCTRLGRRPGVRRKCPVSIAGIA